MAAASVTAVTFSVRAPGHRPCTYAAAASGGGSRFCSDGNGKWWVLLLGWSVQPDYINAQPAPPAPEEERETPAARQFGALTEEKAR
jgi:hypothetical protein